MNKLFRICVWGILIFGVTALPLTGCKLKPQLTSDKAVALIQAQLNQQPPKGATILVNDDGMRVGVAAKYWDRSRAYPNRYWADFKLTDTGKKVVTLAKGGDTIEWRPENPADRSYKIALSPVLASHLKAENATDPQNGIGGTKTVFFDEVASLEGVPGPVQEMARDSQTRVSMRCTAIFAFENGEWQLKSISE